MNIQGHRDLVIELSSFFKQFRLPFLLTGSFAVAYYGFPRATHDIDFITEINFEKRKILAKVIDKLLLTDQYLGNTSSLLRPKTSKHDLFNLVHETTGIKIDFWLVSQTAFDQVFRRKRVVRLESAVVYVISPEDLILNKLRWCKEVMSERHLRDCIGIWLNRNQKTFDEKYLQSQVVKFNLTDLWQQVLKGRY